MAKPVRFAACRTHLPSMLVAFMEDREENPSVVNVQRVDSLEGATYSCKCRRRATFYVSAPSVMGYGRVD